MTQWAGTERIAGTVRFSSGRTLAGHFHLQKSTPTHASVETPLEMLNRPEAFLPLSLASGEVRLVSKDQISAVVVDGSAGRPEHLPTTEPVVFEVQMSDGSEYEGRVHIELRPPRTRGLDFLNQSERFFALETEEATWYLSRSQVERVSPAD